MQHIETISREELKERLERGDDFKLVMSLGEWAFRAKHIPGSINISRPQDTVQYHQPDDEIVVYCSDPQCFSSQVAYHMLKNRGFKNVRRYSGGISEWEEAGYPLEGEDV